MKFARVLIYLCMSLAILDSDMQARPAASMAATGPTPAFRSFPPRTAADAQENLRGAEQAILDAEARWDPYLWKYSYYYRAALDAAWNALLYFPLDPGAEAWKWKMAYYAALSGETELAARIYREQVERALNQKGMDIKTLPAWFQSGQWETGYLTPQFKLEAEPIDISGSEPAYLIQIGALDAVDDSGAMCLLAVRQTGGFRTFLIYNGFPSGGFFPTLSDPTYCEPIDLTGDGIPEIVAHNWYGGHVGTNRIRVLDVSNLPPRTLPFTSSKAEELVSWNGSARDYTHANGKTQIPISEEVGSYQIYVTRYFQWSGIEFDVQKTELELPSDANLSKDLSGYEFIGFLQNLDSESVASLSDQMLQAYLPKSDQDREILEEIRVQKGVAYLLDGESDQARSVFQEIVQSPLASNDIWVQPAQSLLSTYHQATDLYRACSALTACDKYLARMVEGAPACVKVNPCYTQAIDSTMAQASSSGSLQEFLSRLETSGVQIASEGSVDLDGDGQNELWLTIGEPARNYYDAWIASDYPDGIRTYHLDEFPRTSPHLTVRTVPPSRSTIVTPDGYRYTWSRDPVTHEPSLVAGGSAILDDIQDFAHLQSELYSSQDLAGVYEKLSAIADRYDRCPYEISDSGYFGTQAECANYYYTMGLAAELAHDNDTARKMYSRVLKLYPDQPMALLARQKIGSPHLPNLNGRR